MAAAMWRAVFFVKAAEGIAGTKNTKAKTCGTNVAKSTNVHSLKYYFLS
jgi:hypothetical protein